jgi:glutamate-ammonia-ligase adenylyltransferase
VPPRLVELSGFAARQLQADSALATELDSSQRFSAAEIGQALAGADADDEPALLRRLRRLRNRVLLRVMARDLNGSADLGEVCETMSDLAEASIEVALGWTCARLRAEFGTPRGSGGEAQRLEVVAMGKLGGRELNVSSDIDLVFVYAEDGETDGSRRISNREFFERAGRRLIALLSEPTADGFAFRVDMRLRPWGDSGALAVSHEALEAYFVAQGREWERYAWLKARVLTGDAAPGLALERLIRPFVYRKYLDYATVAAMRRLHAEVRREVARRELADHVKLGPGGIREIEFIAQALQLIRGGREPVLAVRATLPALARLAERGLLPRDDARELADAYVFLRRLEHRLQYLEDRQTHTLPEDPDDRARVAAMCGFGTWEAFVQQLEALRGTVTRHFGALFAVAPATSPAATWPEDAEALTGRLAALGFRDPSTGAAQIAALRASQRYRQLPEDSRARVELLLPTLADAAGATVEPGESFARGLQLIEAIARRAAYLALLAEHPQALKRVVAMIAASPWAAEYVTGHPLLLDELLDDRLLYAPPDWARFGAQMRERLAAHAADPERQMNALREEHHSALFRLLAQDLAGLLTLEQLADHLSALADLALAVTLEIVWQQLPGRHRASPAFAVIGYGKLGGKELGYASDLDIIFLYEDPHEKAPEVYARLAQRFNNWITSRTSSGVLFETDLRLRPSGSSGLLVSSVEAFDRYQEESAWTWEHQALTRARFCAGDLRVGERFEAVRERILARRRDPQKLAAEVLEMREKMHAAHPNPGKLFDLKHDRGGMIDVEFAVQYLVLAHAHAHRELLGNVGNIALLGIAGRLGLVPQQAAVRAQDAYRAFRRAQHALRLAGARYARVPAEQQTAHAAAARELWKAVFGVVR